MRSAIVHTILCSIMFTVGLQSASAVFAATLKVDAEAYARSSTAIAPPAVDGLWQFNITELALDGSSVKQGQPVVVFDGGELTKQFAEKRSVLNEKLSERGKLAINLADRERDERLATEEARAALEKARRKTTQPKDLIAGVDYQKLVVERRQAERRMALIERREKLAAEQRKQELRMVDSEVRQLRIEVEQLQRSISVLSVAAPRDGVVMHKSNWQGEKFDVGSQVWIGQSVAEIPDPSTLAVRADLPERELQRVSLDMPARVVIEGGAGASFQGRVSAIGLAVHSKSRVQPIPVVDLTIEIQGAATRLRPGQAVRVELQVADAQPLEQTRR